MIAEVAIADRKTYKAMKNEGELPAAVESEDFHEPESGVV
jgi:hypothetical protein